jgi:hypothetical protein
LTDEPNLTAHCESAAETEVSVMSHDRFGAHGILKQQALKTKDETILVSRLDTKKLEAFLGGQMGAQSLVKLQLEVDKNNRMQNGEDVQDIDELLNAGFINQ